LTQTAKGLPATTSPEGRTLRDDVVRELERIKWFLWHGNVFQALQELRCVEGGVIAPLPRSYAACCPRCTLFAMSSWRAGCGVEAKYL